MNKEELVLALYKIGAVRFGEFKLKSGITSPLYLDLRLIVSYPELLRTVAGFMWDSVRKCSFDLICGVPYTALPIATSLSMEQNLPMVLQRKEAKGYGRKRIIEGQFEKGERCLIVEDLITSGASILETAQALQKEGLEVTDAVLLIDRQQGGKENLAQQGYHIHSVLTLEEVISTLVRYQRITEEMAQLTHQFLEAHRKVAPPTVPSEYPMTYGERAKECINPSGRKLLQLMEEKQSNLAFNPDVTLCSELLSLADKVGPEICLLKTHVDILEDFNETFPARLLEIAHRHNFMIFEDRKFADIGSTVQKQYRDGIYHISRWADITNAHLIPGPGIIKGLQQIGQPLQRGLLLLAEMSSTGNLATGAYTEQVVQEALKHKEFVIGFVAMRKLTNEPSMIHLTPGVQLQAGVDDLGQQFKTPYSIIFEEQSDIIQVGRGIYESLNPLLTAQEYRRAGWEAYLQRVAR